jgi:tetratricopeptide (TPR) repeat protein
MDYGAREALRGPQAIDETLATIHVPLRILEDFRPLAASLEWRLAAVHWRQAGTLPFAENEVPFLVNNSGRLSDAAARLLLTSCLEASPPTDGPIVVLELGAGSGLFALLFLNSFRTLCAEGGHDFYDRLRYLITDASPATVVQWQERGLFAEHARHVIGLVADARAPNLPLEGPVRAVFCNYVLDVLPIAMIRRAPNGGVEQLCVRTHLVQDPVAAPPDGDAPRTLAEMKALVDAGDERSLAKLLPVMTFFEYEVAFRPDGLDALPGAAEAIAASPDESRVRLNVGALDCLTWSAEHLAPDGFLLVNDYGPVTPDEAPKFAALQRFGKTIGSGLNFSWLEGELARRGLGVVKATGDDTRTLHTRLITKRQLPRTSATFEERFSAASYRDTETLVEEARGHVAAGRKTEALAAYRLLLSRHRYDWALVGEVADFLNHQIADYAAAIDIARAAVEINPHYSTWLWNILGDAHYNLGHHADAHEAYLRAARINPRDPSTNLNLTYTHLQAGAHGAALEAIGRGLAHDDRGLFRDRLLEKQRHVLGAMTDQRTAEQERLARRNQRLA